MWDGLPCNGNYDCLKFIAPQKAESWREQINCKEGKRTPPVRGQPEAFGQIESSSNGGITDVEGQML
jgi:hypothetical protein